MVVSLCSCLYRFLFQTYGVEFENFLALRISNLKSTVLKRGRLSKFSLQHRTSCTLTSLPGIVDVDPFLSSIHYSDSFSTPFVFFSGGDETKDGSIQSDEPLIAASEHQWNSFFIAFYKENCEDFEATQLFFLGTASSFLFLT